MGVNVGQSQFGRKPIGSPRLSVVVYAAERRQRGKLLRKAELDELTKQGQFTDGPYRETYGDGMGHPYNPLRQAYGTLQDGTVVFCELDQDAEREAFARLEGTHEGHAA